MLETMLKDFDDGKSKSYYCVAAAILEIEELEKALGRAKKDSIGLDKKGKSLSLHLILDEIAKRKKYRLKLNK